jgi:hypothetical protein
MPKLTHALPKYRKHKAFGQAVVSLNGVFHYLGRHGSKAGRILETDCSRSGCSSACS